MAVLDPVSSVLTSWDEVMGPGHLEPCQLPTCPTHPKVWKPRAPLHLHQQEVWIEREDFASAAQGLQAPLSAPARNGRMLPGNTVPAKRGGLQSIECGCTKDANGNITEVLATVKDILCRVVVYKAGGSMAKRIVGDIQVGKRCLGRSMNGKFAVTRGFRHRMMDAKSS